MLSSFNRLACRSMQKPQLISNKEFAGFCANNKWLLKQSRLYIYSWGYYKQYGLSMEVEGIVLMKKCWSRYSLISFFIVLSVINFGLRPTSDPGVTTLSNNMAGHLRNKNAGQRTVICQRTTRWMGANQLNTYVVQQLQHAPKDESYCPQAFS